MCAPSPLENHTKRWKTNDMWIVVSPLWSGRYALKRSQERLAKAVRDCLAVLVVSGLQQLCCFFDQRTGVGTRSLRLNITSPRPWPCITL